MEHINFNFYRRVKMKQNTFEELLPEVEQIESKIEWVISPKEGVSLEVIFFVESLLNIKLNENIKYFFQQRNGGYIGMEIFSLESCVLHTLSCREIYTDRKRKGKLKNSLVISDDGAGNPILINEAGIIYLFHHDDVTYELVDKTLTEILEEYEVYLKRELE